MSQGISGAEGYAETADVLVERWRAISFADNQAPVLHLLPEAPSDFLDIGAGIGVDAAALAAQGHRVVAVEPVDELRLPGMALHATSAIDWIDDSLPDLAVVRARRQTFDVALATAVWMHLDQGERGRAMPHLAALVRDGGLVILSLRHGPVPAGRRMFEVSAEETIRLAGEVGLSPVLNLRMDSVQQVNRLARVTWTRLAFKKR